MSSQPPPPVTKYRLTVTIRGNTHEEIVDELLSMTRGGYLLASDHYTRDAFDSTGGRDRMVLEHTNPSQTPEHYRRELDEWVTCRRDERRATQPPLTDRQPLCDGRDQSEPTEEMA